MIGTVKTLAKMLGGLAMMFAGASMLLITTETHEVQGFNGEYIDAVNTTQNADRREDKPRLYVPTSEVLNGSDAQPGDTVKAFYLRLNGEDLYLGGITK